MYDSKNMVNDLTTKKAIAIPASVQTQRGGQYSVNIVCAKNNRKSIKLTKKLADKLGLKESVFVTVYRDDVIITLSSVAINEYSSEFSFSNANDFIVYNAPLVYFLAETFKLNYEGVTSMAFRKIEFNYVENNIVAEVTMKPEIHKPSNDVINDKKELENEA